MKILEKLTKKTQKTFMVHARIESELYNDLREYMDEHSLSWNKVIEAALGSLRAEIKDNQAAMRKIEEQSFSFDSSFDSLEIYKRPKKIK